jgi:large subunit ribosomal protein L13
LRTFTPKADDITRNWHVIDADGAILGRLATEVATVLRGKHKPTFTPHVDTGDFVIVINADKVKVTGNKADQKQYYSHSGVPGHLKSTSFADAVVKNPELPIRQAVKGMLPKNVLGRQLIKKLKVYAGTEHPHVAQKPENLSL